MHFMYLEDTENLLKYCHRTDVITLAHSIDEVQKKILIEKLTDNLPVLRAKLGISQGELAEKIGITRQTLTAIESGKREMTWTMFLAFLMVFTKNEVSNDLLIMYNIYTKDLVDYITHY